MDILNWIQENWVSVFAIIGGIDAALYLITKATKATWDDNVYTMIHNIVWHKILRQK